MDPSDSTLRGSLDTIFRAQSARLRSLAYRLTGTREDAEDVVQDAFSRLIKESTVCRGRDLERLLVRVVTNLAIDALRRRRRRRYTGAWLPEPLPARADADPDARFASATDTDPEARYGMRESATLAFQVALEALTPRQRAVVVLGDVLGMSSAEVGEALGLSPGNVRVVHHRARRALDVYDRSRVPWTPERRVRHEAALVEFMKAVEAGDEIALRALLAEQVETRTDANGEFTALRESLVGRSRVTRLYVAAARHRREAGMSIRFVELSWLPAASIRLDRPARSQAPHTVMSVVLDGDRRIAQVFAISAPRKLARLAAL